MFCGGYSRTWGHWPTWVGFPSSFVKLVFAIAAKIVGLWTNVTVYCRAYYGYDTKIRDGRFSETGKISVFRR